jgi:hypothetical protein
MTSLLICLKNTSKISVKRTVEELHMQLVRKDINVNEYERL